MSLKGLETKLSLQGVLSGASDVSSAGVIKKFALGGFSDSSNGIANNALTAPLSYVPGTKNTTIFSQASTQANSTSMIQSDSSEQSPVSNKFSINSSTPEPLAIYSFTKNDVQPLAAAIYQAYFEDKCSLEFSKSLIKKVKQTNEKVLAAILNKVNDEIKIAESNLSLIENYLTSCLELNKNFNEVQRNFVISLSSAKYASMIPDELGLQGRAGNDAISILNYVGASLETLSLKSNTALMTQLMYLAAKQMSNGVSPLLLGDATAYPDRMTTPNQQNANFVDTTYGNDSSLNLKSLSLSRNPNQSFVYPHIEDISYLKKLKIDLLHEGTKLQKAAYLTSMLANEMAISTGLAKLDGTQLGQTFTSTGDYRKSFWGMDEQVTDATTEATSPGSLTDYFVVSEQGQNRLSSEKGVLLFDGSKQANSQNRKNAFDAFIIDSIRSPISKTANKVQQISDAQQSAIAKFDLGIEFFKILQCRDKKAKLLTPRGLFARLIGDFADTLSALQSQETARGKAVIEICLLSILGNDSSTDTSSPVPVIKRSLLSVMAKKALQLQYSLDTTQTKNTANESRKPKSVSTSTRVTTDVNGQKSTVTVTSESTDNEQSTNGSSSSSLSFNPNIRNPRLCLDEKKLFDKRQESELNSEVIFSFGDLPISTSSERDTTSFKHIDFTVNSLYHEFFQGQDGFIDRIVKIYIDLCDESIKFCNESDVTSSPVDMTRLTKNTQIDGTLLLSLLLESACLLSSEFINAKIVDDGSVVNLQKLKKKTKIGVGGTADIQAALFSGATIRLKVETGENTQSTLASQALGALAKASNGNNFDAVFLPRNGNLIIPEMGSLSQTTPISYDSLGQTTVASIVDTFYDLVLERELPALCLSSVAGMIQYFNSVSTKYKDIASQMTGITKQSDEVKTLATFAKTELGDKFFSSLNDFSVDTAKRKLSNLKNEMISASGRNPKLTLGELRCIQLLLGNLSGSSSANNFVVVALPKDFVTKSLERSYAVSLDRDNSLQDSTMSIAVEKRSIFSSQISSTDFTMLIRSPITSDSFSIFDKRQPTDFLDILSNVVIDDAMPGSSYLQNKLDSDRSATVISNEIVSYLLRRMFSVLSSADLFSDNISDFDVFPIDPSSTITARFFAQAYGLSSSVFDGVFSKLPDGTAYINEDNLTSLSILDFDISSSDVSVALPPLKFGEAELFYDLFETVYFQPEAVIKRIFAVPIFDETVGVLVNDSSFTGEDNNTQQVTTNGIVSINGTQQSLSGQAATKQVPVFDTYSLNVSPSTPLVNK